MWFRTPQSWFMNDATSPRFTATVVASVAWAVFVNVMGSHTWEAAVHAVFVVFVASLQTPQTFVAATHAAYVVRPGSEHVPAVQ